MLIKFARVLTSKGLDIESARTKWANAQSVKTVKFSSHIHRDKPDYISVSFNSNMSWNFGGHLSEPADNGQDSRSLILAIVSFFFCNWNRGFTLIPLFLTPSCMDGAPFHRWKMWQYCGPVIISAKWGTSAGGSYLFDPMPGSGYRTVGTTSRRP